MSIIAEKSQSQKKVNTAMMITFSQEKVIMKQSARTFSREDFSRNRDDAARKSHPEKKRGIVFGWGKKTVGVGVFLQWGLGSGPGARAGSGQGMGQSRVRVEGRGQARPAANPISIKNVE
jgi:hypothetical protein